MSMPYVVPKGSLVLVTGATGFTGAVLTRKLAEQGARVRAIARNKAKCDQFSGLNIEWFIGQVHDEQVIKEASAGVEYIFHVAAAYREPQIKQIDYYNVHVKSTKLLAECAKENKNLKCFIHVSTIGVHGHIETPPADEDYRFAPGDDYQITKAEAELWFRDFAKSNNIPFTVIRPAAIYGPGDQRLLKLFKMATKPFFPLLGYGKCLYHMIHVDDLTNAMILAATSVKGLGEVFIVGDAEPIATAEIGRIAADEYGRKLRVLRIPVTPFFILADLCELVCKPFGIEPPIYRRRVAFFTKDRSFNTSKLRNVLGFEYGRSTEQGIRDTARWYKENGWVRL
ncbi:MAG: NAD-dependent epimerase/dehydratase family protein [Deltaproteobacteria bacterium]|nr:NAD-dependent epimerase/dehydratase family protein [Deltaproteobacteria bacterium]